MSFYLACVAGIRSASLHWVAAIFVAWNLIPGSKSALATCGRLRIVFYDDPTGKKTISFTALFSNDDWHPNRNGFISLDTTLPKHGETIEIQGIESSRPQLKGNDSTLRIVGISAERSYILFWRSQVYLLDKKIGQLTNDQGLTRIDAGFRKVPKSRYWIRVIVE